VPKKVLQARGSRITKYGDQRTGDDRSNELEAPFAVPDKPKGLSKYADKKWHFLVEQLSELQILAKIDGDTLERYVNELDRYHHLERMYKKLMRELNMTEQAGSSEVRNVINLLHKSCARLDKLGMVFGLSPADRTRIQTRDKLPEKVEQKKADPSRPMLSFIDGTVSKAAEQ